MTSARFPAALMPLFQPARYKILYGGRGGGKSHGIATYLLTEAAQKPLRVLCCREFQSSIRESVHRLLGDLIERHDLSDRFNVQEKGITGTNGSEFLFEGLRHNTGKIRSLEGIDKVWVEEASNVTKSSWEILIPTIRKDGSEIIVSFNPELDTDETYQRFVANPPPHATVIKINFTGNPWFPKVLADEAEALKQRDPDAYAHVYLGECRLTLDGAIYARELREATEEGRITRVPYNPTLPVNVYFDLGWQDLTSIWFVQHVQGEVHLIDYLEDSLRPFSHYLTELHTRKYVYNTMWLPHDAGAKSLGTGRSIEEIARHAGWRVRLTPRLSVSDGINAVRTLFPTLWFDEQRCADGIQALRHYVYDVDPSTGQFSRHPRHDYASHGCLTADAVVDTRRGRLRIADVVVGDRAWTPRGWAEVTHAGPVRKVTRLVEIVAADGRTLHCTPEHKILTGRGFVRADALRYADKLFRGDEWPIRLTAWFSRVRNTGYRAIITGEMSGDRPGRLTCTGRFGKAATGLFRQAVKSITETATRLITPSRTWSVSPPGSISAATAGSGMLQASLSPQARWPASVLRSGMLVMRVWSGTGNTVKRYGKPNPGVNAPARNVGSRFARLFLRAPSSATSIVKWRLYGAAEGDQWVYDLTCKDHACYVANGILVSNSDALRYVCVAMQEAQRATYGNKRRVQKRTVSPQRAATGWMRG